MAVPPVIFLRYYYFYEEYSLLHVPVRYASLVVWGFITQGPHSLSISLDGTGWTLLLILSLGPTLFGYLLFTVSLQYLSASVASIFHTLEPVMTTLLALLILGRVMNVLQWLGLGLIVVSVIAMQVASFTQGRKRQ